MRNGVNTWDLFINGAFLLFLFANVAIPAWLDRVEIGPRESAMLSKFGTIATEQNESSAQWESGRTATFKSQDLSLIRTSVSLLGWLRQAALSTGASITGQ